MRLPDFFFEFVKIHVYELIYIAIFNQVKPLYSMTLSFNREFYQLINNITIIYSY